MTATVLHDFIQETKILVQNPNSLIFTSILRSWMWKFPCPAWRQQFNNHNLLDSFSQNPHQIHQFITITTIPAFTRYCYKLLLYYSTSLINVDTCITWNIPVDIFLEGVLKMLTLGQKEISKNGKSESWILTWSISVLYGLIIKCSNKATVWHTFPLHAHAEALHIAAVLTPITLPLVDDAFLLITTCVCQILTHCALEETLAPFTAVKKKLF